MALLAQRVAVSQVQWFGIDRNPTWRMMRSYQQGEAKGQAGADHKDAEVNLEELLFSLNQ